MYQSKILMVTTIVITSILLSSCQDQIEEDKGPVIRPVKLITIDEASSTRVNQFPAVIGANRLSELSIKVSGTIEELPISEAQELQQGQLIAQLDKTDFITNVNSAKATYDNAKAQYDRAQELAETNVIAKSELDNIKANYEVAKAQLEAAEKSLADTTLTAPFNGVVAEKMVKNLQTVSAGQVVIKLMSAELFEASVDLPANFLATIPKEDTDTNQRQAFVILDALPDQLIEAEYKSATLLADAGSQTYKITFTFTPPPNLFVLPGMNATVELRINQDTSAVRTTVPLDAVLNDGTDNYVWVVNDDMTVSKQAVTLEDGVGSTMVITSGLNANQRIVGAGAAYLSEGMAVREWN